MKKMMLLLLAAALLVCALSACSASVYPNDNLYYDRYSNVSTTHDGRVNGVNPQPRTGAGTYSGRGNSYAGDHALPYSGAQNGAYGSGRSGTFSASPAQPRTNTSSNGSMR